MNKLASAAPSSWSGLDDKVEDELVAETVISLMDTTGSWSGFNSKEVS